VTVYCFDTSALLDAWSRHYPPDVFPQLWRALEESIAAGEVIAAEEVRVEISKKDDALLRWAKKQPGLFVDLDPEQQQRVGEILAAFPRLVDTRRGRSGADPFVIALARVRGAIVVTGENDDGTSEKPKIPTVCRHFDVRAVKPLDFLRAKRWVFGHRLA
jgi:predicted nucleic acid-binding protein